MDNFQNETSKPLPFRLIEVEAALQYCLNRGLLLELWQRRWDKSVYLPDGFNQYGWQGLRFVYEIEGDQK